MTGLALALVLASAVLHATWNMLAKRSTGGTAFIWLFSAIMTVFYAPFALGVLVISRPDLALTDWLFMAGTGMLHITYFTLLAAGYRKGDLSVVYPLARGTGPMLATVGAVLLLDERPSLLGLLGILCIGLGVLLFSGGLQNLRDPQARVGILYALAIGVIIAIYTLWDKYAMSVLLISPLLYEWVADLWRTVFLSPYARRNWDAVRREWQLHRKEAFGVGILSPLAYILVLTALRVGPVSYIAALREISILIGAVMGTVLLAEGSKTGHDVTRRWMAAAVMVIGVISMSIGG